jgi:hypothetical protein
LAKFVAIRRALSAAFGFDERPAELFDVGMRHRQIGKAPAIIKVTFLYDHTDHVAAEVIVSCEIE